MNNFHFQITTRNLVSGTSESTTFSFRNPSQNDSDAERAKKEIIMELLLHTDIVIFDGQQEDVAFVDESGDLIQLVSLNRIIREGYTMSFTFFPDVIMRILEKFARKIDRQNNNFSQNTTKTKKGDNKMNNFNFGKKITGIFGVSMFDGKPSYKLGGNLDNKWVSFDGEKLVDTTDFTMDLDVPSVALPAMINQIQPNDLIVHEDGFVVVKSVEEDTVYALTGSGVELTIKPLSNPLMGGAFLVKVVNPMAGMAMSTQPNTGNPMMGMGMNPMMLMAMSKDSGDDSMFKTMMMMQMMQQNQNPENK